MHRSLYVRPLDPLSKRAEVRCNNIALCILISRTSLTSFIIIFLNISYYIVCTYSSQFVSFAHINIFTIQFNAARDYALVYIMKGVCSGENRT